MTDDTTTEWWTKFTLVYHADDDLTDVYMGPAPVATHRGKLTLDQVLSLIQNTLRTNSNL